MNNSDIIVYNYPGSRWIKRLAGSPDDEGNLHNPLKNVDSESLKKRHILRIVVVLSNVPVPGLFLEQCVYKHYRL